MVNVTRLASMGAEGKGVEPSRLAELKWGGRGEGGREEKGRGKDGAWGRKAKVLRPRASRS